MDTECKNKEIIDILSEAFKKALKDYQATTPLSSRENSSRNIVPPITSRENSIDNLNKSDSFKDDHTEKDAIDATINQIKNEESTVVGDGVVETPKFSLKPVIIIPQLDSKSCMSPDISSAKEIKPKKVKIQNTPKIVRLSYKINCISDIDEVLSTFEIDIKVFMYWHDDLLIGRKKGDLIDYEKETNLFEPDIIVTNEHNLDLVPKDCNTKIIDSKTGEIKKTVHYKGTVFLSSMDLKLFPFDCQNLQICFKPYRLPKDEVVLKQKIEECAVDRSIMYEWEMLGHCVKHFYTDPTTSSTQKSYSTLFVTILVKRKHAWHVNNVFIPTTAFILISWLVFFFDISERSERNDILMATLLASISNKFVIGDSIPKVEYRTLLDMYLDFSFYLQMTTIAANGLVYAFRDTTYGYTLNTFIFIIEIAVSFLFFEWMFIKLNNHAANVEIWKENSQINEDEYCLDENSTKSDDFMRTSSSKKSIMSAVTKAQRRSSIAKVAKVISYLTPRTFKTIARHIDGTIDSAITEKDHFLHFGAIQVGQTAEIMEQIKVELEKQRGEEVIATIKNQMIHHKFVKRMNSSIKLAQDDQETLDDAARLLQQLFRKKLFDRKKALIHKILELRRRVTASKIVRWYRDIKKKKKKKKQEEQQLVSSK